MANTKELMDFVKSLNDRGLLSKTIEEFDYEWVIWDYQQCEVKKLNIPVVIKRCPYCNEEVNYLNHKKHLYMNCNKKASG